MREAACCGGRESYLIDHATAFRRGNVNVSGSALQVLTQVSFHSGPNNVSARSNHEPFQSERRAFSHRIGKITSSRSVSLFAERLETEVIGYT